MNDLISKEKPILYWFSKIGDFCALSIMWILCCIPVVTVIPSSIALFDSVSHCIHGTQERPVHRFFLTLKNELVRGILLNLIWLVVSCALIYGYGILYQISKENPAMEAYSLVYLFSMLIPLGVLIWLIPVEARFRHTFLGLFRSSAVYAISHLPTTLVLLVSFLLAVVTVFIIPILALLIPAITVTVQCWFVERVFKKYIPQEDAADD